MTTGVDGRDEDAAAPALARTRSLPHARTLETASIDLWTSPPRAQRRVPYRLAPPSRQYSTRRQRTSPVKPRLAAPPLGSISMVDIGETDQCKRPAIPGCPYGPSIRRARAGPPTHKLAQPRQPTRSSRSAVAGGPLVQASRAIKGPGHAPYAAQRGATAATQPRRLARPSHHPHPRARNRCAETLLPSARLRDLPSI